MTQLEQAKDLLIYTFERLAISAKQNDMKLIRLLLGSLASDSVF